MSPGDVVSFDLFFVPFQGSRIHATFTHLHLLSAVAIVSIGVFRKKYM